MRAYVVRRCGYAVLMLAITSVLVFALIQLPPGDYLSAYIADLEAQGETVPESRIEFLRERYGLNLPLYERYWIWASGLVVGDLGFSFEHEAPVADLIGDSFLLTLVVNFAAVIFVYVVAFPIGVYTGARQYSVGDYGFSLLSYIGIATPNFLLALIFLYFANLWFGVSIGGLMAPEYLDQDWSLAKVGSVLQHLAVPVLIIGTAGTAEITRTLRANLLEELSKPYVVTARAKGLSERRLLLKYPVRAALGPMVADIGSLLPRLVSGSVIVSAVMSLPTIGPLLLRALQAQDYNVAGAILMFLAVLIVIGMLISDLVLGLLDPRIRLGGGASR
ncbi:MAG: ABC transporter permease [Pseudomonadota bacterium]